MRKIFLTILFFLAFNSHAQEHFELEGVKVPRTITFNNFVLQFNGYGARSKMFVDLYIQALYLNRFFPTAHDIIMENSTMGVRIEILSSLVASKKISKAFQKGLLKSVGEEGMKKLESQANLLEETINKEETVKGDVFKLIYNSDDESLWVIKNEKLQVKIPGMEFKKAFFGIWLSDDPIDLELKEKLLGK
jgi:hypothetical protein